MNKDLLKALFACLVAIGSVHAQKTISGEVTDSSGIPLPGATLLVQGTNNGIVTDFDGMYTLEVSEGDILVASFVGHRDATQTISSGDTYNFVLQSANELDEVVVTSLGIKREKKALGYAVSQVDSDNLESRAESDVGRILAGKASGVQITNQSGISGSGTSIIIRGFNSFSQGNQPLFIVDGVPFASDTNNQGDFVDGNSGSSRFLDIDPNNIENVRVLKGLAAANLYGTQGRNGVILITTKSGSTSAGTTEGPSKMDITVNSSYFTTEIASLPDYQDQYGNGFDQSFGWFFSNWGPSFDEQGVAGWAGQNSINGNLSGSPGFLRHPYTTASAATGTPAVLEQLGIAEDALYEWRPYDSVANFFRKGITTTHNVNLSSKSAKGGFNLNYGHSDDEGFTPGNNLRRDTFSVGGSYELSNKIRVNGTLNYTNTFFKTPPVAAGFGSNVGGEGASIFANVFYTPRSVDLVGLPYQNPVTGESIYYRQNNSIQHPLWTVDNTGNEQNTHRTFGSFGIAADLTPELTLQYRFGLDTYSEKNLNYSNRGGKTGSNVNRSGILETWSNVNLIHDHNLSLTGSYNLNEKLDLNFIAGVTARSDVFDQFGVRSIGQQVFNVRRHFNYASQDEIEDYTKRNIIGIYAQTELGFSDMLYATLSARQDQVSNLTAENNTIIYPSGSLSWLPTAAFPSIKSDALSYLKMRVGYGTSANFPTGYPVASRLFLDTQDFQDRGGSNIITNSSPQVLGNPNLKPERIDEIEVGFEAAFLKNSITLDVSLYDRITKDLIIDRPLDPASGYIETQTNIGRISNKGMEVDLGINWLNPQSSWKWNTNFNWSTNDAIVEDLGQDTDMIVYTGFSNRGNVAIEGESLGAFVGTSIARDDAGNFMINAQGSFVENTTPEIIGDANPDWLFNIQNSISWKDLSLNFLINHIQGGDIFTYTVATLLGRGLTTDTLDRENTFILPGVGPDGAPNTVGINNSTYYFSNVLYGPDENLVYDASIWRLQELSLGYSLPKSLIERSPFGAIEFSVAGYNLWYNAYNTPEGTNFDPNVAGVGVGNGRGFDYLNGPSAKRVGATLKLTF